MMTWNPRANELFLHALELHSPAEQQVYLDDACAGDLALRAEVQSLLEAGAGAGAFLESPPLASLSGATVDEPFAEQLGTMIGPYKLLEQIGEGGFGIVFMAEQFEPLRRKVALKVLKPGMDTRQVIVRFEAERQALALMDHPHIARVLDAGQASSGRPYFVMELVKGLPITDYCDQAQLAPRQRLELFAVVCQAVQHAHHKGIIHRDLKPTNVLVTLQDGQPLVKVIDFGIAKALGQSLTDQSLFTGFAQLLGTPLYMSPEQAALSNVDVDTRSDVYSLGVLLYELLTGTTPFTHEHLKEASYDELRRIIREEEPPRPSTRISTLGLAATTISTRRQSDPRRLSQLCRGELDWIVMKALEKDRNRRYETASAFAADVQHYLADEPVLACPPSAAYRLRKFARRHRGGLAITAAGTLAVLLAIIGLIVNNRMVTREKQRADRNLASARDAVNRSFTLISEDEDLKARGLEPLRRKLLTAARDYYADFVQQRGQELVSRAELAQAHIRLGSINDDLGDKQAARSEYQQALNLCRQLVAAQPTTAYQAMLARCYGNLGKLKHQVGQSRDAEAALQEALAIGESLVAAEPAAAAYQRDLAATYHALGVVFQDTDQAKQARAAYQKAIDLWQRLRQQDPSSAQYPADLARTQDAFGNLLEATHQFNEAEQAHQQALALLRGLVRDHPGTQEFEDDLAASLLNLGALYATTGRSAKAEPYYQEAQSLWQRLADLHPHVVLYQHLLSVSLTNLANLYHRTGRTKQGDAAEQRVLAIRRKLVKEHREVLGFSIELGGCQCNLGNHAKRASVALDWFAKAIATLEGVLRREPDQPTAREFLGAAYYGRGLVFTAQKHYEKAAAAYREAIRARPDFAQAHCELARALQRQGRFADALPYWKRGHELGSRLPGWRYPSARWVRDCERLIVLDKEFTALQEGQGLPADVQERVGVAEFCILHKHLPLTALRVWTALLPELRSEKDRALQMYNAACAAALAASGQGFDVAKLTETERARWRRQALDWLRAALAVWSQQVEQGTPASCGAIAERMKSWQVDSDLSSLRDKKNLSRLPPTEQERFRKLWEAVVTLRRRAQAKMPAPQNRSTGPRKQTSIRARNGSDVFTSLRLQALQV